MGLGHAGRALFKGSINFPVPCTANSLGLKILELQESPMRFRRKHQDMHPDLNLHLFSEKKAGVSSLGAETGSTNPSQ